MTYDFIRQRYTQTLHKFFSTLSQFTINISRCNSYAHKDDKLIIKEKLWVIIKSKNSEKL